MKKEPKIVALLKEHIEDDRKRFDKQEQDHAEFRNTLKDIKCFMENLSGVSDLVRGAGLLKKPMIWLLAFIVGIIALMGGLKTIVGYFILPK